jgi:acyl dehydratase
VTTSAAAQAPIWQSWIGRTSEVRRAPWPVSDGTVGYYREFVRDEMGSTIPPPFVMTAIRSPTWAPGREYRHELFGLEVPLPLDDVVRVNASVRHEYHSALRVGDELSFQSEITAIEPRTTRLGAGFFLTEVLRVWRESSGEPVADVHNAFFAYSAGGSTEAPAPRAGRDRVAPVRDAAAAVLSLPITLDLLVRAAAGERDFNPLHHDDEYARRVGHRGCFANTLFQQAVACRGLNAHFGEAVTMSALSLRMHRPVYRDTTLDVVVDDVRAGPDQTEVTLSYWTEDGHCSSLGATVVESER